MEVYVEYVFLENFCVDLALLWLAAKLSKIRPKPTWLIFSACLGGFFALLSPFMGESGLLKGLVPCLLCFAAFGGKIRKNEWGRYALSLLSFYLLSFAFAGGVYAICGVFGIGYVYGGGVVSTVPIGILFAGGVAVGGLIWRFGKRIYERKAQTEFFYPCELVLGERIVRAQGFVDSGNVARKDGTPVCFLTADLFFSLAGERAFSFAFEEMAVTSVSGEKKIKLFFLDEIRIYSGGKPNIIKKPYGSLSYSLSGREYKVLLGAWALNGDGTGERDKR